MMNLTLLCQHDERWADVQLGNDAGETIGASGCLLCCVTMVQNALMGTDETPLTMNEYLRQHSGFMGALLVPGAVGMPIDLRVMCRDAVAPLQKIDDYLADGVPVIVEVRKRRDAEDYHWVVLTGDAGADFTMLDPAYAETQNPQRLLERYGWSSADVVITGVLVYRGISVKADVLPGGTKRITALELVNVRVGPGSGFDDIGDLRPGQWVERLDEKKTVDGVVWSKAAVWIALGDGSDVWAEET